MISMNDDSIWLERCMPWVKVYFTKEKYYCPLSEKVWVDLEYYPPSDEFNHAHNKRECFDWLAYKGYIIKLEDDPTNCRESSAYILTQEGFDMFAILWI